MAMQIHHMNFSLRLFRLLSDEDPRIVCFVENGTAFKVSSTSRLIQNLRTSESFSSRYLTMKGLYLRFFQNITATAR